MVDGRVLINASMGGAQRNPPWLHHWVRDLAVIVEIVGEYATVNAHVTAGPLHARPFEQVRSKMPGFAGGHVRYEGFIRVIEPERV